MTAEFLLINHEPLVQELVISLKICLITYVDAHNLCCSSGQAAAIFDILIIHVGPSPHLSYLIHMLFSSVQQSYLPFHMQDSIIFGHVLNTVKK